MAFSGFMQLPTDWWKYAPVFVLYTNSGARISKVTEETDTVGGPTGPTGPGAGGVVARGGGGATGAGTGT
jgi:hypothetical protein